MKLASQYRLMPVLSMTQDEAEQKNYERKLHDILHNDRMDPGMRQVLYEDLLNRAENFRRSVKEKNEASRQVIVLNNPQPVFVSKKAPSKKTRFVKKEEEVGDLNLEPEAEEEEEGEEEEEDGGEDEPEETLEEQEIEVPPAITPSPKKRLGKKGSTPKLVADSDRATSSPKNSRAGKLARAKKAEAFTVEIKTPRVLRSNFGKGSDRLRVRRW